jgi:hypothetical protein
MKLRHLLAVLILSSATTGFAHAITQDITLSAIVPGRCLISGSPTPTALTHNLSIDPTSRVATTAFNLAFPVACNRAASLVLTSTHFGLTGPAALTGHDVKINYAVVTSGVFPTVTLDTRLQAPSLPDGGSPYASSSSAPANGTLTLAITPLASALPLAAGVYSDTLRLTIAPLQ